MKRRFTLGLLMSVLVGFALTGTTVTKKASWYDPEPKGIIANTK